MTWPRPLKNQNTLHRWEPTPNFLPRRKMKLYTDIAHVGTSKKMTLWLRPKPNRKSAILGGIKRGGPASTDRPESQSEPEDGERGAEEGERSDKHRGHTHQVTTPLLSASHLLLLPSPPKQEGGEESTTDTPPLSSSPSPKLQDFKCNVCGYGYYGNDPADLVKHFRKYHLGLHNRTRQDAALDTHILALHNMAPQHLTPLGNPAFMSVSQHRTVMMNGTYDVQVTLGATLIGIGRKTSDCQGNTKYFRCKFCNFTYMGSNSLELEQHFLSSHPNKVKTPPTTPSLATNNLSAHDHQLKGRSQITEGAERVAVRAEDDSLVGYSIPVRACTDSPTWTADGGRGGAQAYYWCKFCSWSCEGAGGSAKLLEHYEHVCQPLISYGSVWCLFLPFIGKDDKNQSAINKKYPNSSDSDAVVTSYNCQLCDFRYSMAHSADVIVVAPLLLHYQHNHSIHRCCIQHCMYCPQGLCQPHKHLGEVSHPFACRKSNCPKCSVINVFLCSDWSATLGVTHLCDQCAFATTDIDVLLQHYESCHTLISLKGAPPHVKAEEDVRGDKDVGRGGGGDREYTCTKCHFITEVEEEIFRHYRRVHACCRCRRCDFTAPDSSALLDHFNSAHCHDSSPSLTNGCSAPSTLAIKEESKGDLRLLYSLAPPEGRLAEGGREDAAGAVKSEGGEDKDREREKGWVIGETRALGERGGEQAHGLLWVPKERMGPERGVDRGGGGSPSLFPSPLSLSFVSPNHEASQQKRGVASPRGGGGGGGSGGQDPKGGATKEESQSLLRVRTPAHAACTETHMYKY
uniref:Trichorhinophalangeal syndrome I n=1 Tax=Sphaeramia orbicularis TaxID=375764 RepID=A0A672ZBS9_9TELE